MFVLGFRFQVIRASINVQIPPQLRIIYNFLSPKKKFPSHPLRFLRSLESRLVARKLEIVRFKEGRDHRCRGEGLRGEAKNSRKRRRRREREREGDAWTKSGSDGAAQWNGSTPAADANGQPTHWRYLGYSQCVCAGLTFLFIEQSRLSLSLSSLPLLSTPPLNLPFLPSSTDGFTLSPSLPPSYPFSIFFHPLLQFARSAPIYSLIFVLSSLLFLSSKLSILLYECLSSYSSLFQVNVQRITRTLVDHFNHLFQRNPFSIAFPESK